MRPHRMPDPEPVVVLLQPQGRLAQGAPGGCCLTLGGGDSRRLVQTRERFLQDQQPGRRKGGGVRKIGREGTRADAV